MKVMRQIQLRKPPDAAPGAPTTEKRQSQPPKNELAKPLFLFIIIVVLLLLTAGRFTLAVSANAPILGNMSAEPSNNSSYTVTATPTSQLTTPKTPTPSSTPETTVGVFSAYVNLRSGPGTNFAVLRQFTYGERLVLLGRLSDNSWLFVNAFSFFCCRCSACFMSSSVALRTTGFSGSVILADKT